jgi:hypothetical protein
VRGYDAGKQVKGRKRHLLVDTLGLVLAVMVHMERRACYHALQSYGALQARKDARARRVVASTATGETAPCMHKQDHSIS